jgi:YVTN family beta-propeller protein
LAVTPDGSKVYVANNESNTVSVIDAATNTVTTTILVGMRPVSFASREREETKPYYRRAPTVGRSGAAVRGALRLDDQEFG